MLKFVSALGLSALLFAMPLLAHADAASKHAKIEEMMRITKMDDNISKVMDQTRGQIQDMVDEQRANAANMPPDQAAIMNKFQKQVQDLVMNALKMEDVHPQMVKLYDEAYTEEELDGILAFYKTPAGQALLNKTPDLMDKVMGMVQQRVTALSPQMDNLAAEMQKQMAALPHNSAAPDTGKPDATTPAPSSPAPAPKP